MFNVRTVESRDFDALASIYGHHVLHGLATFEEVTPTADEMRGRCLAVQAAGLPYLVAEVGGRVVGYSYATPYRPRPAYRYTVENSVYVAHDATGQGIGSALLAALIERCEIGPWRQMLAVIGHSGNAGSIALHHRHGFEPIGTFRSVGFKLGQWVDTVLMQRALGDGDAIPPTSSGWSGSGEVSRSGRAN